MNDLERDLRELFDTKARNAAAPPTPTPNVLKRARRRQAGTAAAAILGGLAILTGSILGVRALITSEDQRQRVIVPALPTAPEGFRAVTLPYASLTYPEDWFLVVLDPTASGDRVLQLTNFDAGAARIDCEQGATLPPGGVLLEVQLGAVQEPLPAWPTTLGAVPGGGGPCGADGVLGASWTASGTEFSARGLVASNAAPSDIERLEGAFGSMTFPETAPQTERFIGASSVVLDSADSRIGPLVLYSYEDASDGLTIGVAGPAGSRLLAASSAGRHVPRGDEDVTMFLEEWGAVVWGDVSDDVARAELRTVEGGTYPATLIALPESLEPGHQQAVWGILDTPTADRVTTLLYDEQGNVLNDFYPTGPRVTIATGTDPQGGPWELFLESTNDGTGLSFSFTNGGGGGGCCLRPLDQAFQLDGWGTGSDEPGNITAVASEAVTRVAFEASDGTVVEGALYPVPDASLGIPQVGLVIVPSDVKLEGDLVGYDAGGDELGREFVGEIGEPAGPTPEIDAVWSLLRDARDAIGRVARPNDWSLEGLTWEKAVAAVPKIAWNASGAGKPVPNEVSIRGVAPAGGSELTGWSGWNVVLVSITPDLGHTYCIAVNIGENGGGNYRYGTQDAATYEECGGGWPELQG